jgi:hypothetical protein
MGSRPEVVAATHSRETTPGQDAWVARATTWPTLAEFTHASDGAATGEAATSTAVEIVAGTCVEVAASAVVGATEASNVEGLASDG